MRPNKFCLDKALEKAQAELATTTSEVRRCQLLLHIDNIKKAKKDIIL